MADDGVNFNANEPLRLWLTSINGSNSLDGFLMPNNNYIYQIEIVHSIKNAGGVISQSGTYYYKPIII